MIKGNLISKLASATLDPKRTANLAPLTGVAYSVKYISWISEALLVSSITSLYGPMSSTPFVSPLPPSQYGMPPRKNCCLFGPKLLPK